MKILAADIGGTKTCLTLIENEPSLTPQQIKKVVYDSNQFTQFDHLLNDFLRHQPSIDAACFAVAGPIAKNQQLQTCQLTNLPWLINSLEISQRFNIPRVSLINDFEAAAYGIDSLKESDLIEIQPGIHKPKSRKAMIGAGTGLGQAFMIWQKKGYNIYSTEGGHVNFGPTTQLEYELLEFLSNTETPITYEDILSGKGLVSIYSFLNHKLACAQNPLSNSAQHISQLAISGPSSLAGQSMKLFVRIYGSQASNVALTTLPYDGLYIAGGIAAKNSAFFTNGEFLHAFLNKPKMQQLLTSIPVKLIINQEVGLLGAIKQAELPLS